VKRQLIAIIVIPWLAAGVAAQAGADNSVAGIQLYPGGSSNGVQASEKVIKDTGYPIAVCRRTPDSIDKVVAFYRRDKQLELGLGPITDSAQFFGRTGNSMSITSPWVDMNTGIFNKDTLVCIVAKAAK
jgi:hypothetical protein